MNISTRYQIQPWCCRRSPRFVKWRSIWSLFQHFAWLSSILGVLGCLTHIWDHNRCTFYRMSLLNEKWRSYWPHCNKMSKWRSLTSTFGILVTSSIIYILNSDLSQAPWRTPKMTPHLTILRLISKLSKWRSPSPPLFTPRWPPVWFTSFFNPDWV